MVPEETYLPSMSILEILFPKMTFWINVRHTGSAIFFLKKYKIRNQQLQKPIMSNLSDIRNLFS